MKLANIIEYLFYVGRDPKEEDRGQPVLDDWPEEPEDGFHAPPTHPRQAADILP